jgi:hypothetical protein
MFVQAQPATNSSPARWTTPRGTYEASRAQPFSSSPQALDSLILRWSTNRIAGDVHPLVANVVNDSVIPGNSYAPQEIVAVVGGELLMIDANGRVRNQTRLPAFIKSASAIFDDSQLPASVSALYPAVVALESIERRDSKDSLAVAYLAAFDAVADTAAIIKRLTLDVAPFAPNLFASIRPFFAKAQGNNTTVFCTVDMSSPVVDTAAAVVTPYFRGMTSFTADLRASSRQLNVNDTLINQFTVAPSVSFTQPAVTAVAPGSFGCILPSYPDTSSTAIPYVLNPSRSTVANKAYITGALLSAPLSVGVSPFELIPDTVSLPRSARPRVVPSVVQVTDAVTGNITPYVLVAEEYTGRDGSQGISRVHLFDAAGAPVTIPRDSANPSFSGKRNHAWSVCTGDVDGDTSNHSLPYYPHNAGNEILLTQTTQDLASAGSRLMVLRYRTGARVQKETKRTEYLYPLDTVVTQAIPGWVACVSDLDSAADAKAEIIMADGGTFMILRMRDYTDRRFTQDDAFDTVYTASFAGENINDIAVADIDGDGKNDIIVTTNMRCAVFGQPIRNTLRVTQPGPASAATIAICQGDSLYVQWRNFTITKASARVLFRQYTSDSVAGNIVRVVAASVPNGTDSVRYSFKPDSSYAGLMGRFIVQSTSDSLVRDSSCVVFFKQSRISLDSSVLAAGIRANETLTLSGSIQCVDSVVLRYTIGSDTTTKHQNSVYRLQSDTTYSIDFTAPCVTFPLQGVNAVPVRIRAAAYNQTTQRWVQSAELQTVLLPAEINVTVASRADTLCSDQTVLWYLPPDSSVCASMTVAISTDGGRSFVPADTFARGNNRFEYKATITSPDSIVLRFWCAGSCYRSDTTLYSTRPKLVKKIAPNPFEPGAESCGIYSTPPVAANATLKIFDEREDLVKELVVDEMREKGKVYCDYWDGTTADGRVVTNGMYYLVISYSEGSKEYYPIFVRRR